MKNETIKTCPSCLKKELVMLKETFICIVIVIAIIFGNNITQDYTKESINELSNELMALREKVNQENVESEEIKNEAENVYKHWEKRHEKLAYYIEHDELEKVETGLIGMKSDLETGDYEELVIEIDKSIFILKHIEDKYEFNLQNIF